MAFNSWCAFFLLMTAIAYTPGPMTMFSMSSSVRHGFVRTLPAIAGGSCAYITQMVIVYLGLGVIVQSSTLVFNAIKWIGVAYLIMLAIKNWRQSSLPAGIMESRMKPRGMKQFWLGYVTGMSNPKSILVFTVLFPQFIEPAHYTQHFLILAVSFFVTQGSSAISYALFGARVFRWLHKRCLTHIQSRVTAVILFCAGGMLAVSDK